MDINQLINLLPVIIPIVLLELGLMIAALVHLLRHKAVKRGSMVLWLVLILFVQIIGPVLYFLLGREDA